MVGLCLVSGEWRGNGLPVSGEWPGNGRPVSGEWSACVW